MVNIDKPTKVLVSAIIGTVVVSLLGDALTYEAGTNGTGFEEGSPTAEIVGIAPMILVALGLYGAFSYM